VTHIYGIRPFLTDCATRYTTLRTGGGRSVLDRRRASSGQHPSGRGWLRILVEILDVPAGSAVLVADDVLRRLDESGVHGTRLLHGEQAACWPLVGYAARLGLANRIDLEDPLLGAWRRTRHRQCRTRRLALDVWTTPGRAHVLRDGRPGPRIRDVRPDQAPGAR
jgi:hypothetical protein